MRPPADATQASYFDGETARRHMVDVRVNRQGGAPTLEITGETIDGPLNWPLSRLRGLRDDANSHSLTVTLLQEEGDENPRDTARLRFDDPQWVTWIRASRPNLFRRDVPKGQVKRLIRRAALAVVAVVVILFVILPAMAATLAGLIPLEREIAFGKQVTAQMEAFLGADTLGELHCAAPEGRAALDKMMARLTAKSDLAYTPQVAVFDHNMLNAFAAPGGQIVLMRGLIERSETPDQVAAVLAHEIGHVEARDPTRASLRAAGSAGILSLVIGDFAGATVLAVVGEHVMNASYSRTAEAAADDFALDMLDRSNIDIAALAGFFDILTDEIGEPMIPEYLSTHPATDRRAERAREVAAGQVDTAPILDDTEWQALRNICTP